MTLPLASLVLVGVAAPLVLFGILGAASIVNRPLPERWTGVLAAGSMSIACAALLGALILSGATQAGPRLLSFGSWSTSHEAGIAIEFLVDRAALGFGALAAAIAGVVSAFSYRYLHREPGYNRYFVLLSLFVTGMLFVALAGNVEVLFVGWELVGLSSALLVAFFHERPASVRNALRVFAVYRVSDAAMLSAAVLLRHAAGTDSLSLLFGARGAPAAALRGADATVIAVLLITAVAAKSALLPFSGWLPRAMEGPTPSSAVYYGSLSIHAGCFLLLRSTPLLVHAPAARVIAGALGLATAAFAALATRVQSDVKSSLAYASLTQVGLIVVEIALGWNRVAFIHLAGHASFRLLQFLSAPNVLHDLHGMQEALHDRSPRAVGFEVLLPDRWRRRLYLLALERGFLDSVIDRAIVTPFTSVARMLTELDARLCGAVLSTDTTMAPPAAEVRDE